MGLGARTDPPYHEYMFMTDRDRQIILAVERFGQLTTGHIRGLFFKGLSNTPSDRALLRLTQRKYLARIERPLAGGNKGGSGQYVYQLGSKGWTDVCRIEKRYWPYRATNPHMLAIADAFLALKALEEEGRYAVAGFETEPDTWLTVAGAELRPDLYVEIADPVNRQLHSWWVEVDMGTERKKQLGDKMARYYHVWEHSEESTLPTFPLVVFLVPDEQRAQELRWLIGRGKADAQQLFRVELMTTFPRSLLS